MQKYEPRAFQANGPAYFWHRRPKMEISTKKANVARGQ